MIMPFALQKMWWWWRALLALAALALMATALAGFGHLTARDASAASCPWTQVLHHDRIEGEINGIDVLGKTRHRGFVGSKAQW